MAHQYKDYDFILPPELKGNKGVYPVVVLGGGPVGMTAALELAKYGIQSIVLQKAHRVANGSRAICISRRSLEILDRVGVGARVAEKGLWWSAGESYYGRRPVFRLEMPHSPEDKYPPFVNIQQYYLEEYLVEACAAAPLVDLRWHSRGVGVTPLTEGVRVSVQTPQGDYEIDASYVIAADGARSTARDALGLKLKGSGYEGRYLIADIILNTDLSVERRAWFDPDWRPGGTVLMHAQPDHVWRIDYQLYPDESSEDAVQEGRVRQRIQQHLDYIGIRRDWTLEWTSVYQASALALDDYQCGRVFFAGDAAHLVPIFGVRGLNSGFEDAHNLAWKLAAVLGGSARPDLLKSYSVERRAATLETFEKAEKSTFFMTPPTRGFKIMRTAVLSLALTNDFVRPLINPRQSAPIAYETSVLTPPQDVGGGGVPPGGCFPNPCVIVNGSRRHLSDILGEGFTVLHFSSARKIETQIRAEFEHFSQTLFPVSYLLVQEGKTPINKNPEALVDTSGHLQKLCSAQPESVVVLRPDGHVLARVPSFEGHKICTLLKTCLSGERS